MPTSVGLTKMNPKYPVYIVSKNRWDTGLTYKALDYMRVPYKIVVERDQFDNYANVVGEDKLLILPEEYIRDYDTFWIDGDPRVGPGAARNFCWDRSIDLGFKRHWVMDDNLDAFHRNHKNLRTEVASGTIFKAMEDFVDRYENVYIAGPNYYMFMIPTSPAKPFTLNTRIYSCLLIQNDIPYRWRGRYNEDTDIALRVLKDGFCTIQFNAFLQGKITTQKIAGGNSQEFYFEGTKKKSQMLVDMHPDVTRLVWKFNRWHHDVNYRKFKQNQLIFKEGVSIDKGVNNYGMKLVDNAHRGHKEPIC